MFALPIDPESITNLQEAKNAIEKLLQLYMRQQEELYTNSIESA